MNFCRLNEAKLKIKNRASIQIQAGERGFAMIMVLVLLLVGSLILTPLLSYMSTGILKTQIHEELTTRYYSAEAGVENALWGLISENVTVPEGGTVELPDIMVNDMTVNVHITDTGGHIESTASSVHGMTSFVHDTSSHIEGTGDKVYGITSVAYDESGSNTTLLVHSTPLDFSGLLDNAITSRNHVTFQPGSSVNGTVVDYYSSDWPAAGQLIEYYRERVDTSSPYGNSLLDIKNTPLIIPSGTLYREGNLEIINSGTVGTVGTLNGNLYVTGDLNIGLINKDFTLDLNGKTIFVEGQINIGGKCTFTGFGCIIAVGDVYFSPQLNSNPNDFIFVMSIDGTIFMNPMPDFYGSLAGNIEVQLQPNSDINWTDPSGKDFNFPDGSWDEPIILDWIVTNI